MRLSSTSQLVIGLFTLTLLSACGGGGDANDLPADGTLAVESGGSSVPQGSYTLDTNYTGASGPVDVDGLALEVISPENGKFDMSVLYSPADARKVVVSFDDNTATPTVTFVCRSNAWSVSELLASDGNSTLGSVPVCNKAVTIDLGKHRITFSKLSLPAVGNAARTVTLSANFSWVPQTEPIVRGGGSGSGSITLESGTGSTTAPLTPAPVASSASTGG
jgi:hypothetical protein